MVLLTSKRVARVCQHQLSFLSTFLYAMLQKSVIVIDNGKVKVSRYTRRIG